jgi:hypothetical protein
MTSKTKPTKQSSLKIKIKIKTDRIRGGKNIVDKGKTEFTSFLVEMS